MELTQTIFKGDTMADSDLIGLSNQELEDSLTALEQEKRRRELVANIPNTIRELARNFIAAGGESSELSEALNTD